LTIFIPIIIPLEPERPPFHVTVKVEKQKWQDAKPKLLSIAERFVQDKCRWKENQLQQSRFIAGTLAVAVAICGFIAHLFLGIIYGITIQTSNVLLALFMLFGIYLIGLPACYGVLAGLTYAKVIPFVNIKWLEVRVGRTYAYVEVSSDSKSWLIHFLDDVKEEGVEYNARRES